MTKRVAVINDLSGLGKCSLTAQIAVLSALGVQPCPIPTAVLSNQTEFPHFFSRDLSETIAGFGQVWRQAGEHFDGACTGYFANGEQLDAALDFMKGFSLPVIVDPVMGDDGKLYPAYDKGCCLKMKALVKTADIITPNLTELCILTDNDYEQIKDAPLEQIAALAKPFPKAVITGIHRDGYLNNLVVDQGTTEVIRVKKQGGRFSGTGDIFSAVVCGCTLRGKALTEATQIAADFIAKSVSDTIREAYHPLYGICFEQNLNILTEVSQYANHNI